MLREGETMKKTWATTAIFVSGFSLFGQTPPDKTPITRYGVVSSGEFYPQTTAKEALGAVVKALENKRYEYIAAHLLDPEFIEAKVTERARTIEPDIEKTLTARRTEQQKNPSRYLNEDGIPLDPQGFNARLKAEAEKVAFQTVVRSIAENLTESPENIKVLAKFTRDGTFTETGTTATVTLKDQSNKQVFLKQIGTRWFLEDKQQEEAKPKADK
jgi:hypothetical protein